MNKQTRPDSGFSKSQEAYIRAEITAQLIAMKRQIDVEIAADLEKLSARINSIVAEQIDASEQRTAAGINAVKKEVEVKVATAKNQIVLANNNQLATVQEQTKQMMQVVGQQITNATYKKVIADINREIVPKVNNMVEYVNYQMQDAGEVVTDYRKAVERQANNDHRMLTDGNNGHVISEHVSLFFREDN